MLDEASAILRAPAEIFEAIAHLADEQTIWRLMGTDRRVRSAVRPALLPHLEKQVLAISPAYKKTGVFEFLNKTVLERDCCELTPLRELHTRFQPILASTIDAAIRDLTLYPVRDDDREAGWNTLRATAPHLRRLDIFVLDRHRLKPIRDAVHLDSFSDAASARQQPPPHLWEQWKGVHDYLRDWSEILGPPAIVFPHLTTLILASTARGLQHLHQLARYAPNLVALEWNRVGLDACVAQFGALERLVISGAPSGAIYASRDIIQRSPRLRYLSIYTPPAFDWPYEATKQVMPDLVRLISDHKRMFDLALYGGAGSEVSQWMYCLQQVHPDVDFARLKALEIEGEYYGLGKWQARWPLLVQDGRHEARLPSLRRLAFVDRRTNSSGAYVLGALDRTGYTDFFPSDSHCCELFHTYPKLDRVEWLAGIPLDPLNFGTTPNQETRIVRCSAERERNIASPSQYRVEVRIYPEL